MIDERGQPLAGAAITVVTADWTTAAAQAAPHAISTADGRFRIEADVARELAGSALVVVSRAGHATACLEPPTIFDMPFALLARVCLPIGDVMLPPATTVRGKVRTRTAQPVTGAIVEARCQLQTLLAPSGLWQVSHLARTRSDANGEFTLADAIADGVVVRASASGFRRQTAPGTIGTDAMLFELEPGAEVVGELVTPDGAPVRGMACVVQGRERGPSQATAADGSFRLGIDLAGPFVVEARPFGAAYEFLSFESPMRNRATDRVRLPVPAATDAKVVVRDQASGRPLANAEVRIAFVTPPTHEYVVVGMLLGLPVHRTDANGELVLPRQRIAVDAVAIGVVQADGLAPAVLRGMPAPDGQPVVIELVPGGKVAGVVRDLATGQPIAGARIRTLGVEDGADSFAGLLGNLPVAAVSDADGRYQLPDLGPGPLRLRADAPGFAPITTGLQIAGTDTIAADFALPRGHTLTAELHGADAESVVGLRTLPGDADADVNSWNFSLPFAFGITTRQDGKFVLPDLHGPQQVEALLMLPSYRGSVLTARLGPFAGTADTQLGCDLDRSSLARLRGRVRLSGAKLPRHRLAIALADTDLMNDAFAAFRPGDDGRFELPVPATWFAVMVVDLETGLVLAERTLRGESSKTHEVDIQLELHEAKVTLVGDPTKLRQCSLHLSRPEPDTLAQMRIETGDAPILPLPHALAEGRTEFTVLAPTGPLHATLTQGRPLARRLASADITVQAKRANRLQLELP
ncbi:MAG: carboxypeptidase-like regulatory domain-containing protein [Planctomycetes bacterium]|nr:carboxypeptidase-like regulatory domain-containing protein [Planctomycetota bacterium]